MLKVASYNVHKAIGTDRRRNPGRIIDVLNEINADIITLQEADRRFGARAAAIPQNLLEMHSDYRAIPLDVQTDSMGWHGNAILVRKPTRVLALDIMHIPCLEPRGAIIGHLEFEGKQLAVFGMHLDLSGLWRRRQAAAIIKHAQEKEQDMPVLLMGDLNEWSAASGCLKDFSRAFQMVTCGRSFHSRRPIATLDRIMHSDGIHSTEAGVHDSPAARKASDHLPVWANITVG
ncbi:endonuclease/exonuclease/phosphatase family protein [Parasphingorhabdus sp.]|uniref:endonuclease/exonuclease/phosphatase family protein n=1 Tax=Parasphingorhabdus sp. TaxID=2709688 RepID=UPI003262D8A5